MNKVINIFKILGVFLILDFIFTYLIISKFEFHDFFYPNLDHRISNVFYHHSFKKNVDTIDVWGKHKYKFITNSLGFKDKKNREIKKNTDANKRILINGDSFIEGIGFSYEDTFVGYLDKYFSDKEIEILNAGVASQSPILYYKKIKYLLEVEKIYFNELILFLDISDVIDEYYYFINYENDIKKNSSRDILQEFFIHNFSSYLFLDVIFSKINLLKDSLITRFKASKFFNEQFFYISSEKIHLYNSIHVERGNWTHNDHLWEKHGQKGRKLAEENLNKLITLCENHKVKFSLIIYPWPNQIYFDIKSKRHRNHWKNWSIKNNVNFIDLFDYFDNKNSIETINKLFIPSDVHWNRKGQKYIFEIILKEYFNLK